MAYDYESTDDAKGEMLYDLRQIFAKDILGETLKQIAHARKSNEYSVWYMLLKRDLKVEIYRKLTDEEIKDVNFKIDKVKKVLVENKGAYLHQNNNSSMHELIVDSLVELECLLTKLMETHNMYGNKRDDEGL